MSCDIMSLTVSVDHGPMRHAMFWRHLYPLPMGFRHLFLFTLQGRKSKAQSIQQLLQDHSARKVAAAGMCFVYAEAVPIEYEA